MLSALFKWLVNAHKAQRWPEETAHSWAQCSLRSKHTLVLSLGLGPQISFNKMCPEPCLGHKTWQSLGSGKGKKEVVQVQIPSWPLFSCVTSGQ